MSGGSVEKKHIVDTVHLARSFAQAALSDLPRRDSKLWVARHVPVADDRRPRHVTPLIAPATEATWTITLLNLETP